MSEQQPLKITLNYYNKEISTQIDHSDVKIEELHELWMDVVRAMGYHPAVIKDFYKE